MLIQGETFEQHREFLFSFIHSCQAMIKACQKITGENKTLARQVIADERTIIKETYAELKELQRWFNKSGLEPDEPFYYKKEGKNEGNGLLA